MRTALSTGEVALLYGIAPGSVHRYLTGRAVQPLSRVRVGRATVTRWAMEDVRRAAPAPPGGAVIVRGQGG